ncbi:MAG: MoxR family ATPase [Methanomicrobia archaeon]|nr:MoxR family ATPase [Methanomicrobia archaeon]RLF93777.1 MAG: magnesium chelatase [Thermococci archaeon]RLF96587.1 MAG: magnesium chelatase [Thermococci archaeon]HEC95586.1 MoxR family ATPase [Euryarchaeota archaeon]
MDIKEVHELGDSIVKEVSKAIVGKGDVLELFLVGILANGHLLIEDLPGLAKTMMARSFSMVMDLEFSRIQFTPDLLPADILGTYIFKKDQFEFRKGPIFANIVLADEINRAPPKTQSALLEVMEERQITIEGDSHPAKSPFFVIATQNPIEMEGTYPLPEAQIDRFMMRLDVGYPQKKDEIEILNRRIERKTDNFVLEKLVNKEDIIKMQKAIEEVYLSESVLEYIVNIVSRTREVKDTEVGASPRGSLALMKLSKALAALEGREYAIPDDIKAVAIPALAHRVILRRDLWYTKITQADIIKNILESVPVPKFK